MRPHKYLVTNVLFDDEEECERHAKYDKDGTLKTRESRLKMLEERQQQLGERKEHVLQRTLQSTKNALEMLRDSEDKGIAASSELARQGESLQHVNVRLDTIAVDMRRSERHLSSIESVICAVKNRIRGKSKRLHKKTGQEGAEGCTKTKKINKCKQPHSDKECPKTAASAFESHPSTRLHGLNHTTKHKDTIENKIEETLEDMVSHVARLKDIGLNMEQEIDKQNVLLDVIQSKVDQSQCKMDGQMKRMKKIL